MSNTWTVFCGLPVLGALLCWALPLREAAAQIPTGFVAKTVERGATSYAYQVYVPPGYTTERKWPVILFLHGAGERGDDGKQQTEVGLGQALRENPQRIPAIVVLPQCRAEKRWEGEMAAMALACLEEAQRDYRIDEDRVYLTGLSMGGLGTWEIAAAQPERFAALVPICGLAVTDAAEKVARLPIWCLHGDADPVVPVDDSRKMVAAIQAAGGTLHYTELAGVGHDAWTQAYSAPTLWIWLFAQRRGKPDSTELPPLGVLEGLDAERIPRIEPPKEVAHGQPPMRVKVLVLEFNPWIPGEVHSPHEAQAKPKPVREVGGWNDPLALTAGYMADVQAASGGLVQFNIVDWLIVREFQKKTDGHVYTPEEYMRCWRKEAEWHKPDGTDYPYSIRRYGLIPRIESREIDEVWWIGAPYFGWWESAMAGRGAFEINGGVYGEDVVACERPFAVMGFNYERGVAEMLHDLSHRAEATMTRIYGGWRSDELTTNWARFAANAHQSNGVAAVGSCHYPPNGEKDYDYTNPRFVESSAPDWLYYPDLTGKRTKSLNCEEWGGPDYHRTYMNWWFGHLPRAPGVNADGRLNNWWRYVFRFEDYDEQGNALAQVGARERNPTLDAKQRS